MRNFPRLQAIAVAGLLALSANALADVDDRYSYSNNQKSFKRVATLANYINNDNRGDETVSEIVAASRDGRTLVYTDSELETIGFVWIGNPANPIPTGTVSLPGEPTSVDVWRNKYALVAVDTSESLTETSGKLVVVNINNRSIVTELELGGQPDSIKISPNGRYAAVAIENERDEELCVGGQLSGSPVPEDGPVEEGDISDDECEAAGGAVGIIPQTAGSPLDTNGNLNNPAGFLAIVDLQGKPSKWSVRSVDLTGLSALAPSDPEPEFVDINRRNLAAVTLQENNHLAVVDLRSGRVVSDFDLGTVDLFEIDAVEDDVIKLTDSLFNVPREPDAVAWVGDDLATANEGDLFGGSRGYSLFGPSGQVLYDAGNTFEHLAVQHGHYPEGRSENKGSEPESIEYGKFAGKQLLFVGSERGSFIAVYDVGSGTPSFEQFLPGPLGPEGLLAIPNRNLLVVSGEDDDPTFGVRSSIMIYEYGKGGETYPQIKSATINGLPIPWSAMSGMDALPNGDLLAVWDSFYAESRIFTIDPSQSPALVTDELTITGGTGNYDPEGIAIVGDGTYWIASEGNRTGSRLNRLLHVDAASGQLVEEVFLPDEIEACRAAERAIQGNIGSHSAGFEGAAILPTDDGYRVLVAQQRGWDYTTPGCEALDDDPDGSNPSEPGQTRIWVYNPADGQWDSFPWELEALPENASWVGLSEITLTDAGDLVLIERDNRTGDFTELKTLVKLDIDDALDGVTADEKSVYDMIPDLEATNGWITDKPEGIAINSDGVVYLITDNDGVDDWSGESWFIELGELEDLFDN